MTDDDTRTDRPKKSNNVSQVYDVISQDRRRSVDDIANILGLSHRAVHTILTMNLV